MHEVMCDYTGFLTMQLTKIIVLRTRRKKDVNYHGSHSTWKTWKSGGSISIHANIMEF